MRPSFNEIYMNLAHEMAKRSTCARLQVGCIITDVAGYRVLSVGYNGNYRGGPNGCDSTEPGKCGCIHAEENAVIKLNFNEETKVAYVTHLPCKMCAKRLVNAGISKVFYRSDYRIKESLEVLKNAKVEVEQI